MEMRMKMMNRKRSVGWTAGKRKVLGGFARRGVGADPTVGTGCRPSVFWGYRGEGRAAPVGVCGPRAQRVDSVSGRAAAS